MGISLSAKPSVISLMEARLNASESRMRPKEVSSTKSGETGLTRKLASDGNTDTTVQKVSSFAREQRTRKLTASVRSCRAEASASPAAEVSSAASGFAWRLPSA